MAEFVYNDLKYNAIWENQATLFQRCMKFLLQQSFGSIPVWF